MYDPTLRKIYLFPHTVNIYRHAIGAKQTQYNFGSGDLLLSQLWIFFKLTKAKLYPENELQFLNFASPHAQGCFVIAVFMFTLRPRLFK